MRYLQRILPFSLIIVTVGCSEFRGNMKVTSKTSFGSPLTYDYINTNSPNYFRTILKGAPDKKAERNRVIYELLGAVDNEYREFERKLRADRAYKDIVAKWISIGLTAGASLSAQHLANLLAAIDTGFKGANEAVDKNAFKDNASEFLINQMRTKRSEIAAEIYDGMNKDEDEYPIQAAIRDIERYYNEGFVTSALVALAQSTGVESKAAATKAEQKKSAVSK